MTDQQSPSQRLQARLAALGPGPNSPQNRDPAEDFIQLAEDTFSDPMRVVVAVWTKQQPDNFLFSRVAHDFSDVEAFAFKLVMIMAGLGAVSRSQAEYLIATITYADGKANVRRNAPSILAHQFKEFHQLSTHGLENQISPSYADIAPDISHLTLLARESSSQSVRTWVSRYVGGQTNTATTSTLFSETPGPYALPLGTNPSGRTVYYTGEASLVTIAPPGKGKTQCHILPTLASYRGPAVVLDVKGECYDETASWRAQNVGPVIRFNPVDPDNSAAYNPLTFVDSSPEELWESSRFLAELLVVVQSKSDATWETQGKDLLTLIIAFVASVGEPQERTMATVLDLIATLGLAEMLDYIKDPENNFPNAMRRTAARFAQMSQNAPKQFEGVLSGASQHLQVWEGPKVEKVTKRADWSPQDLRQSPYPTLYLCIPPKAIETYSSLLRVIIGQHVRQLMRPVSRTDAPILFLLDELPRLGRMEPIREALEIGRSYGIKLWMIAQHADQLLLAYPNVGEGMIESCDVRMFMSPSSATADKIEKAFGVGRNIFTKREGPQLSAQDILGPTHRDSIFVLGANEQPMVLRKRFFHQR